MKTLIRNATIVNEGRRFKGSVLLEGERIRSVEEGEMEEAAADRVIDAKERYLIPGLIDDQVHFREPGMTQKEEILTGSMAAVSGGVTSYMEMPNTKPPAITLERLEEKFDIARERSFANHSFFMGASNENLEEVLKVDPERVCGVKVFMGASTGNMLVDDETALERLFSRCNMLIATHCEDEGTVKANEARFREKYGEEVPIACHPSIRSEEACYRSSSKAVELARKHGTRLHVLHISTAKELELFETGDLEKKRITAEACIHHLHFCDADYEEKGTLIKWNPAVKTAADREAVFNAVLEDRIDVIATDHAPHTLEEKAQSYFKAPSGGPLLQHGLLAMMEKEREGRIGLERIVEKMCHAPARMFHVKERGFIRPGYYADLVLLDPADPWTVERGNVISKCGWSPFEGTRFHSRVTHCFVNGALAYRDEGEGAPYFPEERPGQRLGFELPG